jgi:hypothetical protein
MHNLTHSNTISASAATAMILDACRANERRASWIGSEGHTVSFYVLGGGHHEAALRGPDGVVIALASVDKFDC